MSVMYCRRFTSGDHVYKDEPLADEEWLKEYKQQQEEKKK